MERRVLLHLIAVSLCSSSHQWAIRRQGTDHVTTATGEQFCSAQFKTNRCVALNECQPLFSMLTKSDPFAYDYIRNMTCGQVAIEPDVILMKVCCAPLKASGYLTSVVTTSTTPKPTSTRPKPTTATKPELRSATVATVTKSTPLPAVTKMRDLTYTCGTSNLVHSYRPMAAMRGEEAPLGGWPWLVLLGYRTATTGRISYQCSGVLVTNQHVVAAAHCLYRRSKLVWVRVGEHDFSSDSDRAHPQNINISLTVHHELYNPRTMQNDLAVIKLARKVHFNDFVQPICLPPRQLNRKKDATRVKPSYFVAGWGSTSPDGNVSSVIRQIQVPLIDAERCSSAHKGHYFESGKAVFIDKKVICTGFDVGKSPTCQGGSGGPLMKFENDRFYLLGIASHSYKCGDGYPGVYTRLTQYMDWINTKLK